MVQIPNYGFRDIWACSFIPFFAQAWFCGNPKWSTKEIPDLSGKKVIVTGGNAGIGKETTKALLEHNANVYIACRDSKKAEDAIEELHLKTGKKAIFLRMDLSDLKSVKAAAKEFMSKEKELHILFNNAGVMFTPMEQLANGHDLQMHTNVVGPFYFTKLLLPILISSAKNAPDGKVRVITTSSSGHYIARANPLNFNTFKDGPARAKYTPHDMYIQSKFANIVFAQELARLYEDRGIVSTSVNPGNLKTDLNRHINNFFEAFLLRFLQLYPADMGALTQLWAGTSHEGVGLGGKYLIPWAKIGVPREESLDPQLGKDLWTWLEEQVEGV
ncbi:hypothetical protein BDQ12DRAFT_647563 [Crucibulum laeve]|uniref:NAD(P)-binding protein n=1 Tax=Crucibulum laeve TaxID=68775 RepID=A0A5C3M792_9AGAR|nr:hypothetical protein BDQ12DRAFT_647563 [Crucibulum laeve]